MRAKPYVGITGAVSVRETKGICNQFSKVGYSMESPHIPMIGFLVSYKTLNEQVTKNRRYPSIKLIPELLEATNGSVLTMIHYNSKETDSLSNQVAQIFDGIYQNELCRAIQLNIVWPNLIQVKKIKDKYLDMQIVFQVSGKIIDIKTPFQIVQGVSHYGDLIDYALIDPSSGAGVPFNLETSVAIYSELREQCPNLTIGFAGGFSEENVVSRLEEIIKHIGRDDFCTDAEGGMRDKITNVYGDDLLSIEKVRRFFLAEHQILK